MHLYQDPIFSWSSLNVRLVIKYLVAIRNLFTNPGDF